MSIYDAAINYQAAGIPLIVIAGQEWYRQLARLGSQRSSLTGVKAVVAQSFERIHRSNLVGMGVVPCQLKEGASAQSLKLDGSEVFDLLGIGTHLKPRQDLTLVIHRAGHQTDQVPVTLRIDTPIEIEYYRHGGILPYVLRQLIAQA
jgi:aconitate hydratase